MFFYFFIAFFLVNLDIKKPIIKKTVAIIIDEALFINGFILMSIPIVAVIIKNLMIVLKYKFFFINKEMIFVVK